MEREIKPLPRMKQPAINPRLLVLMVVAVAVAGGLLIKTFSHAEEQRALVNWQNKLGLIADSRAADIDHWLDFHFHELSGVAANPSLQLYVTAIESGKPPEAAAPPVAGEDPAQVVFLRNLLLLTADRLGFIDRSNDALKAINANVHTPTGTGLAILDNSGKILVSTEGLPALDPALATKVSNAPKGQSSLIDIFTGPGGAQQIGFVLPVYAIQGDATADQQIGKLVGIKNLGDDFFRLLLHPGATEKTLEAMLVRREGDNVTYISAAKDKDAKPLASQFTVTTPDLDAAYAITTPGSFAVRRDRQSHLVLMTSRAIANSPWVLLLHIDRDQALADSDSWRDKLVFIMGLAILALIALVVAVWHYGTSRRAMLLSMQTARLASHSVAQERLLRLVTDNQPEPIFITDQDNIVRFANEKASRQFNLPASDVLGKDLAALMGGAAAKDYTEANRTALAVDRPLSRSHRVGEDAKTRVLRTEHIPLKAIPIDGLPGPTRGVLVVDQDVTEIVREREKRVRTLRRLVATLVQMVDARDPHASNHSACVALVAHEVAIGMALEPGLIETAQTAGNLMNIGKIVLPPEMLTKRTALAEDEIQAFRSAMGNAVSLLEGLEFEGPVVETLRQSSERYDGTGPLKLKGEEILVTARIIAVANSFIGMISPRAYRAASTIEQATAMLLSGIDTQFDRRVVVALINFVENRQGRKMLSEILPKKAS